MPNCATCGKAHAFYELRPVPQSLNDKGQCPDCVFKEREELARDLAVGDSELSYLCHYYRELVYLLEAQLGGAGLKATQRIEDLSHTCNIIEGEIARYQTVEFHDKVINYLTNHRNELAKQTQSPPNPGINPPSHSA